MVWRRLEAQRSDDGNLAFQTFDGGEISIAELTRASAAFPGIPPWRLKIPDDPTIKLVSELPKVAFLADGGLWNNLGTQAIREDRFIGRYVDWEAGILRPYLIAPGDIPVLCLNGSAPLKPTKPWAFRVPGIALLKSMMQYAQILNANTVQPRIEAIQLALDHRHAHGIRPDSGIPCNLVAGLMETEALQKQLQWYSSTEQSVRDSDPSVKEWENDVLSRAKVARRLSSTLGENLLDYIFAEPEGEGSYPVVGLANLDDWDRLKSSSLWRGLIEREGKGRIDVPTTLDRIDVDTARRLIARGYLNTYLTSLFLAPLSDDELDRLADLEQRLDRIVGKS